MLLTGCPGCEADVDDEDLVGDLAAVGCVAGESDAALTEATAFSFTVLEACGLVAVMQPPAITPASTSPAILRSVRFCLPLYKRLVENVDLMCFLLILIIDLIYTHIDARDNSKVAPDSEFLEFPLSVVMS